MQNSRVEGRSAAWALLAGAAVLLAAPAPARAHAILLDSVPALDGSAAGPAVAFDLRFNSRIDHKRSRLTLTNPDKSSVNLPVKEDAAPDRLDAAAAGLAPGAYSLRWQVLAVDGHITRGDIPFTVTAP